MDKRIKIVCFVATFIAIIMVAPYFILFHYGFSNDSSAWSNFGDYINGILTPILTTVNIYVFIRLTSKISEIEDNRTNEAIQQERERSIKELEQAKSQFEQQLEHEKNLMYFQFPFRVAFFFHYFVFSLYNLNNSATHWLSVKVDLTGKPYACITARSLS